MGILRLSELIGQKILDLRFHYIPENEYGLQSFHSYLKLANELIISIPKFDNDDYLDLTEGNLNFFKEMFETGDYVNDKTKRYFAGEKITDFYFSYYDEEIDLDSSAIIKLSNNYYLTENNFGPVGLTDIDLIILDEKQFVERVSQLNEIKVDVRSITKTKNAH